MLTVGQQLGRYRLLRLLASSNMSDVYLAEDERINQQVVIKIGRNDPSLHSDPNADRLFRREATAIAMLDHPHILSLIDYGEVDANGETFVYIVMPYRKEGSFSDWLSQRSSTEPLSSEDVEHFLSQAADALQYAHDLQIIHRDVKPSNFLIRSNKKKPNYPDLLLTDFGIARLNTTTSQASQTIRGTLYYMAPEQWNNKPVPATDQYALAVMAYQLLTNRFPFEGDQQQVMYQHLYAKPLPPSTLNPSIPVSIDTVILRALAKKPEDRFASISEFSLAFQEALQPSLPPTIPLSSRPKHSKRNLWIAIVASLTLAVLLVFGSLEGISYLNGKVRLDNANATATAQILNTAQAYARATMEAKVNAASTTLQNPYPPYGGTLVLNDPLNAKSSNKSYQWDQKDDCIFTGEAYHAIQPKVSYYNACFAAPITFSNFAFQIQMTIISGDCGAIIFRGNSKYSQQYYFRICQNGKYALFLYVDNNVSDIQTLKFDTVGEPLD